MCRGISTKKFSSFDDRASRVETKARVGEQVKQGWGKFQRALNYINPYRTSSSRIAGRLVKKAERLEYVLKGSKTVREVDEQLGVITQFMALTLTHDSEERRAFQQTAMRNEGVAAIKTKPGTFKEMRAERSRLAGDTALNPENLKTSFEKDMGKKGEMIGGRLYAVWTSKEKMARFKNWDVPYDIGGESMGNVTAQEEKKTGLIGAFFRWLLESLISRQKQQVQFE